MSGSLLPAEVDERLRARARALGVPPGALQRAILVRFADVDAEELLPLLPQVTVGAARMVRDAAWAERCAQGASFAAVARESGVHTSTVAKAVHRHRGGDVGDGHDALGRRWRTRGAAST